MKISFAAKKVLCLLMAVAMLLLSSVSAFASGEEDAAGKQGSETTESTQSDSGEPKGDPKEQDIPEKPEESEDIPSFSFDGETECASVEVKISEPADKPLGMFEYISYRIDNGEWIKYTGPLKIEKNCKIYAKITRISGEESEEVSAEIQNIDDIAPLPPQIVADKEKWVKNILPVTIVSGTDVIINEEGNKLPGGSGLARTEYRLGEEGLWHEYTGPFSLSEPATLFARSVDKAGNESNYVSERFDNFDVTAPDCSAVSFAINSDIPPVIAESGSFSKFYKGKVTVTIDGAHDSESGVDHLEYQFAGANAVVKEDGWKRYAADSKPVINGDFCGYVCMRAVDKVGNVSQSLASDSIVIDVTAPVISNIALSTTAPTDQKVSVTFSVKDNVLLDTVRVNGQYVSVYSPSFTAFRNGDYLIEAVDKAGNKSTNTVKITNINASAFNLLAMYKSLSSENFTPSTWAVAQTAASELEGLLTVGSSENAISAASEKLVLSMEGLVVRGDGTASLRLIEKIKDYDSEKYTDSSWEKVQKGIENVNTCLANPERTQEEVDTARRGLEDAVTALVPRGDFTNLDRLVEQCGKLDKANYDPNKFAQMEETIDRAKKLPRTDTAQPEIDEVYRTLIEQMSALKIIVEDTKKTGLNVVMIVVLSLLVIAIGTAVFIFTRRMKAEREDEDEYDENEEYDEDAEYEEEIEESAGETPAGIGDFVFTDDGSSSDEGGYIGHRR